MGADDAGNVWVAWHAPEPGSRGEEHRRVWVARSSDEGKTFAAEFKAFLPAREVWFIWPVDPNGRLDEKPESTEPIIHSKAQRLRSIQSDTRYSSRHRLHDRPKLCKPLVTIGVHAWAREIRPTPALDS